MDANDAQDNRRDDDPQRREEEKVEHTDREREWGQSAKAELKAARDRLRACEEREAAAEALYDRWDAEHETVKCLAAKS